MKRPGGFTFLSLIMGWLAIAGFANGAMMISGSFAPLPIELGIIAIGYGITAAFSSVLLWRFNKSAVTALRSWMAICIAFFIAFVYSFSSMFTGAYMWMAGVLLFIAFLFFLLDRYVRRKFDVAT